MKSFRYSKVSVFGLFLLTVAFIGFFLFPKESHASSFPHTHTDDCYTQKTGTCSNHHFWIEHTKREQYCFTCDTTRVFDETIYWEICDNGYQKQADRAYYQECPICHTTRRNETQPPIHSHQYSVKELSCGLNEGDSAADVSLNVVTSGYSNTSVTISASVSVIDSHFSLAPCAYDFGSGFSSNASVEVTENGTYTVIVQDSRGKTASASVTVSTIDKDAPVILSMKKSVENWTEEPITITVEASDAASGLSDNAYSFNGGAFSSANTFTVKSNGKVTVMVQDRAGNISEGSLEIANIGKDPAVIAAEKAAAEKAAAERAAAEKAAAEKAAAEKAAAEKAAAERAAADKIAADRAATERALAEKAAAEAKLKVSMLAREDKAENAVAVLKESESEADKEENEASLEQITDDVSENSMLIPVTDYTLISENSCVGNTKNETEFIENVDDLSESSETEEENTRILKASAGLTPIKIGAVLAVLGILFLSFFNYIYVSEGGKIKIVSLCRVKKEKDRLVVRIAKGKLKNRNRYLIYLSPWNRRGLSQKTVNVEIEGEKNPIATDERTAFDY